MAFRSFVDQLSKDGQWRSDTEIFIFRLSRETWRDDSVIYQSSAPNSAWYNLKKSQKCRAQEAETTSNIQPEPDPSSLVACVVWQQKVSSTISVSLLERQIGQQLGMWADSEQELNPVPAKTGRVHFIYSRRDIHLQDSSAGGDVIPQFVVWQSQTRRAQFHLKATAARPTHYEFIANPVRNEF